MTDMPRSQPIAVEQRRVIFQALVEAQDGGASAHQSRANMLHRFAMSEAQMLEIEAEGIANDWPLL
jgi:hypothetical protein